ncbi:MAG: hypothetical protein RR584_11510 [Comamonas sp.]
MALAGLPMWGWVTVKNANHGEQIALLRASLLADDLQGVASNNALILLAIEETKKQRTEANEASKQVQASLAGLRTDTLRMRGDFASLTPKLKGMERSIVERYASTCTALLADLAEEGELMAIEGAEIANRADGHFADDAMRARASGAPSAATLPKTSMENNDEHNSTN